jgi:small nuclear ribonucleoprotein (snRNP)-like protein
MNGKQTIAGIESAIDELIGHVVVLDVSSPYVYVGTLTGHDEHYLILTGADVHDLRDTATNREIYVLDSRRHGVRANRTRVLVRRNEVVSLSVLDDVLA